jgi:hypothetical protein
MFEDSLQSPPEENTEDRHVESVEELVCELAPGFPTPFQPPDQWYPPPTRPVAATSPTVYLLMRIRRIFWRFLAAVVSFTNCKHKNKTSTVWASFYHSMLAGSSLRSHQLGNLWVEVSMDSLY